MKKKLILTIPYLFIITVVSVIMQDQIISMLIGIICGLCYFGFTLPHYEKTNSEKELYILNRHQPSGRIELLDEEGEE